MGQKRETIEKTSHNKLDEGFPRNILYRIRVIRVKGSCTPAVMASALS